MEKSVTSLKFSLNSKHHHISKFALKLIWFLTVSNLFPLEVNVPALCISGKLNCIVLDDNKNKRNLFSIVHFKYIASFLDKFLSVKEGNHFNYPTKMVFRHLCFIYTVTAAIFFFFVNNFFMLLQLQREHLHFMKSIFFHCHCHQNGVQNPFQERSKRLDIVRNYCRHGVLNSEWDGLYYALFGGVNG